MATHDTFDQKVDALVQTLVEGLTNKIHAAVKDATISFFAETQLPEALIGVVRDALTENLAPSVPTKRESRPTARPSIASYFSSAQGRAMLAASVVQPRLPLPKPKRAAEIRIEVLSDGRFAATLNGRRYATVRRRDLVRQAKRLGLNVAS